MRVRQKAFLFLKRRQTPGPRTRPDFKVHAQAARRSRPPAFPLHATSGQPLRSSPAQPFAPPVLDPACIAPTFSFPADPHLRAPPNDKRRGALWSRA